MKIIVPMAGRWFLRPYTLTIPKPLIPIAGKPIVHRVEDIAKILDEPIDEIAFILGDPAFGDDLVKSLEVWRKA
jgi:glucose-1-phosphate thymidylyltransferase